MLAACCLTAQAQRMMEDLNRGLVAVQTEKGVFTSWRIHGTEYYDFTFALSDINYKKFISDSA